MNFCKQGAVHLVAYTIVPIVFGIVMILAGIRGVSFFGSESEKMSGFALLSTTCILPHLTCKGIIMASVFTAWIKDTTPIDI